MRRAACAAILVAASGCRPAGGERAASLPGGDTPLQRMVRLEASSLSGPTPQWTVESPRGDVLDNDETLFLSLPRIRSFKDGRLDSTLTAERGWLDTVSQTLRAQENVVVVSTDGARLDTTWLVFDGTTQIIRSTAPVRIERPDSITHGDNLVATMDLSSVSLAHQTVEIPQKRTVR